MEYQIFYKLLPYRKFLFISAGIYFSQFIYQFRTQKTLCLASNLKSSLLEFDKNEVSKIKNSRVFVITNPGKNTRNEETEGILENLKKLYKRYPNLQSYLVNIKDSKEVNEFLQYLKELNFDEGIIKKSLYELKENLENNSIFLVNKYGDVKTLDENELEEVSKDDSNFNFFEKFTILNNKNSLLELGTHSFVFFVYLNSTKSNDHNYSVPAFRVFRKIFFNLSFFNIKFFVGTNEFTGCIKELGLTDEDKNSLFLIKRCEVGKKRENSRIVEINNEKFELIKIVDNKDDVEKDDRK